MNKYIMLPPQKKMMCALQLNTILSIKEVANNG